MPAPAAIRATFHTWRPVNGRKCLQLVFEIPMEQQSEVLKFLGAPMPDNPEWFGIAKLNPAPVVEATTERNEGSQSGRSLGRERYAGLKKEDQAVARAAMLCGDPAFQEWISYGDVGPNRHHMEPEEYARHRLCARLGIVTRKTIADSPMVLDAFLSLETEFLMATGRIASPS